MIRSRPQRRVGRRHDQLQLLQLGRLHVHAAVGAYVGLDAFDQPEPAVVTRVERVDLAMLFRELAHRHAAGDRQAIGMIRHGAELVPALDTAFDDRFERLTAVAPDRMHLQVAAIVRPRRSAQFAIAKRREHLRAAEPQLRVVFIDIDIAESRKRVAARPSHLFPASLVDNQFATLESPVGEPGVFRIEATEPLDAQCNAVLRWLEETSSS